MDAQKQEHLKACLQEVAQIPYDESDPKASASARVSRTRNRIFFIYRVTKTNRGRGRELKSCMRTLKIHQQQARRLGLLAYQRLSPTDWINAQPLTHPLVCLGDGHDNIWNLFRAIGTTAQRFEILDWYHLKENLYKVGGSLKRLVQAET